MSDCRAPRQSTKGIKHVAAHLHDQFGPLRAHPRDANARFSRSVRSSDSWTTSRTALPSVLVHCAQPQWPRRAVDAGWSMTLTAEDHLYRGMSAAEQSLRSEWHSRRTPRLQTQRMAHKLHRSVGYCRCIEWPISMIIDECGTLSAFCTALNGCVQLTRT